jgi:hypothetical protein
VRGRPRDLASGSGSQSLHVVYIAVWLWYTLIQDYLQMYNPSTSDAPFDMGLIEPLQLYSPLQPSTAIQLYIALQTVYILYNHPQR